PSDLLDDPVGASSHAVDRLASRDAVPPDLPPGSFGPDVLRGPALVEAVVPLCQVVANLSHVPEPGDAARLAGSLQRRDEHAGEGPLAETAPDGDGVAATRGRERDIGPSRVAERRAPFGLSVAEQDEGLPGRDHAGTHGRGSDGGVRAIDAPTAAERIRTPLRPGARWDDSLRYATER